MKLVWCWCLDDVPEWERELQAELQEYEVVDDGNNVTDADLEQEIMKQIEAESQNTWTPHKFTTFWQTLYHTVYYDDDYYYYNCCN